MLTHLENEELKIREARDGDRNFIINSWVSSYYSHSAFAKNIPSKIFFSNHHKISENLLSKGVAKVAVGSEDDNVIVGYIILSKDKLCIHYLYVKENFRGLGICRRLLSEVPLGSPISLSHLTYKANKIRLEMGYLYNPYLMV